MLSSGFPRVVQCLRGDLHEKMLRFCRCASESPAQPRCKMLQLSAVVRPAAKDSCSAERRLHVISLADLFVNNAREGQPVKAAVQVAEPSISRLLSDPLKYMFHVSM